jgi:FkbM family methyltransferase
MLISVQKRLKRCNERMKICWAKLIGKKEFYNQSHSQHGEDKWLSENYDLFKKGFFVDVGAGDPVLLSNTYYFERNGWNGICVEADEGKIWRLQSRRDAIVEQSAVSDKEGEVKFEYNETSVLSGIASEETHFPTKTIQAYTLNTILEKHNVSKVDLLSIDVEGFEINVLRGLNFDKYKPQIVISEYIAENQFSNKNTSIEIIDFFKKLPYTLVYQNDLNLIFVHNNCRFKKLK